jgi:hypothetical protein
MRVSSWVLLVGGEIACGWLCFISVVDFVCNFWVVFFFFFLQSILLNRDGYFIRLHLYLEPKANKT